MASKITVQVVGGGSAQVFDGLDTIAEIKTKLGLPNHTAAINGDPASDSEQLDDYSFVQLSPPVKGGF